MNFRKPILYCLLIVLGLISLYNYLLTQSFTQYSYGMGMGMEMHRNMYTPANYYIDFRLVALIAIIIAVLLLLELFKPQNKSKICKCCGMNIDDDKWKICPMCGAVVNKSKG